MLTKPLTCIVEPLS